MLCSTTREWAGLSRWKRMLFGLAETLGNWITKGSSMSGFAEKMPLRTIRQYPLNKCRRRSSRGRYQLMETTDTEAEPTIKTRRSKGTTALPPPPPDHLARAGSKAGIVDPQHARLQKRLMQLLQGHFGKENVTREGGWGSAQVDLVVKDGQSRLLIEIKPYATAREALREAIGQILEYAYFSSSESSDGDSIEGIELFIVAPALADKTTSKYVSLLQTRFQMPIHYCSFSLADPIPAALIRMGQGRDKPANTHAIRNPRRVPSEAKTSLAPA